MMEAGRELDALVAETVMGCTPYLDTECPIPYLRCGCAHEEHETPDDNDTGLAHYSTDIADAWEVMEKCDNCIEIGRSGSIWTCIIGAADPIIAEADTAPHAICLAALKALGEKV